MPQIKFSTSLLGEYLSPKIISFFKTNTDYMRTLEVGSVEDGSEMIAHAISYGIALALSSTIMKAAFKNGVAPPPAPTVTPGGPVGTLIYNNLQLNIIET